MSISPQASTRGNSRDMLLHATLFIETFMAKQHNNSVLLLLLKTEHNEHVQSVI